MAHDVQYIAFLGIGIENQLNSVSSKVQSIILRTNLKHAQDRPTSSRVKVSERLTSLIFSGRVKCLWTFVQPIEKILNKRPILIAFLLTLSLH